MILIKKLKKKKKEFGGRRGRFLILWKRNLESNGCKSLSFFNVRKRKKSISLSLSLSLSLTFCPFYIMLNSWNLRQYRNLGPTTLKDSLSLSHPFVNMTGPHALWLVFTTTQSHVIWCPYLGMLSFKGL